MCVAWLPAARTWTQPISWTSTWWFPCRITCTISSCWKFTRPATIGRWHTSTSRQRSSCRRIWEAMVRAFILVSRLFTIKKNRSLHTAGNKPVGVILIVTEFCRQLDCTELWLQYQNVSENVWWIALAYAMSTAMYSSVYQYLLLARYAFL